MYKRTNKTEYLNSALTVGELKRLLSGIPENLPVLVVSNSGNKFDRLQTVHLEHVLKGAEERIQGESTDDFRWDRCPDFIDPIDDIEPCDERGGNYPSQVCMLVDQTVLGRDIKNMQIENTLGFQGVSFLPKREY